MPSPIQFSQASLQDYADCPRRYQLRFVLMQPWPALITGSPKDAERHLQRGADFHRLVHQHNVGLEPSQIAVLVDADPILKRWWRTYLEHPPTDLPSTVLRPEVVLSSPVAGHRLVARLDLLAVEPGSRAVVVDWKTSLRRPARSALAQRLQTRVYRYLLVTAGAILNARCTVRPEQAEMIYWFCEFDGATERLPYDSDQFAADESYFTATVREITSRRESIWPPTPHEDRCRFCSYQSLCERRVKPAFLDDLEDDQEMELPEIDIEQIAEVAF